MTSRRSVLTGLVAVGLAPRVSWADVGSPAFLTAARRPDQSYALCGLTDVGEIAFDLPLPGRGHAAAAHPFAPLAVAFARRPGRYALIIDCIQGREIARLEAPEGRHFYGHGTYSADGTILYTTENDFEAARGVLGLWAAGDRYRRIGEIDTGGIGPHDVLRLPGRDDLVVANGGIETHPDTGRAKLNLPLMRPNLTYLSPERAILDRIELPAELHQNSIRHLDALPSGEVAFAMQWEGSDQAHPPLLGLHLKGQAPQLFSAPPPEQAQMLGYAGSVAFSQDGNQIAITSPRGARVHVFSSQDHRFLGVLEVSDVCGVARGTLAAFHLTSGTGTTGAWTPGAGWAPTIQTRAFDNHLIHI